MGSSKKSQLLGYRYYLWLHAVLCHGPVDKMLRLDFDDRKAWQGTTTGGSISVSAEYLFGGDEREGGVSGAVDVEMGYPTQTRNPGLLSLLGSYMPAFRGVVGCVFKGFYFGMNPYLKRPSFWLQRIHVRQDGIAQWYDAKAAIGTDMNPAHIIRECITDPNWGMGYPETEIDDTSFQAAADLLYAEGTGLSLLWDTSVALDDFITEVLKHIDASLYVDTSTGKFCLAVARPNYDVNTLLELGEDDISKITDYKRTAVGELVNSVTVVFWDYATGKNNSVTVQDIALAAQQQTVIGTTKQLPGFTNSPNATKAATRILRALSVPLTSGTVYATRKASSLKIGSVFKMSWPRYGIQQMVMRVVSIEHGTLSSSAVKLQVVEDYFGIVNSIYTPPEGDWQDPVTDPQPIVLNCLKESTYYELRQLIGESVAPTVSSTSGYFAVTCGRPSSDSLRAIIFSKVGLDYLEKGVCDFCPTALIAESIPKDIVQIDVELSSESDLDLIPLNTYAILNNEILAVRAINGNIVTLDRGILDTVPQVHTIGDRIYFPDSYFSSDNVEYFSGETARVKLLSVTGKGTLDISLATEQTVSIAGRHAKPYPPGNFKINSLVYPTTINLADDIVVSWSHRDRIQQTADFITQSTGNIGPEAGTSYTVRFYNNSTNTLLDEQTAIAGTSATFTADPLDTEIRVELFSVRSGIASYQQQSHVFTRV